MIVLGFSSTVRPDEGTPSAAAMFAPVRASVVDELSAPDVSIVSVATTPATVEVPTLSSAGSIPSRNAI